MENLTLGPLGKPTTPGGPGGPCAPCGPAGPGGPCVIRQKNADSVKQMLLLTILVFP